MLLAYKARGIDGQLSQGVLEADSIRDAQIKLRQKGQFALSIEKHVSLIQTQWLSRPKRLSRSQLFFLTTQLNFLLSSGLDLSQAIASIASEATDPLLRNVLTRINEEIKSGCSFATAITAESQIFGETFAATIAAGEESGHLNDVLGHLREYLEKDIHLLHAIRTALAYPLMLLIVTTGVLMALFLFVLPQFASVFEQIGRVPPLLTQCLLSLSEALSLIWASLLVSVILVALAIYSLTKLRSFREWQHHFGLTSPLTRSYMRPLLAGRSFTLLGTILQSGIPMLTALRLCARASKNHVYRLMYQKLEEDVLAGRSLSSRISTLSFLPNGLSSLVTTAERTGELSSVFLAIGEHYEKEGQRRLQFISRLVEPIMISVMGAITFIVVASIVLPLLDLTSVR